MEHNDFSNIRRNHHTSRMRSGKRNHVSGFKPNMEGSYLIPLVKEHGKKVHDTMDSDGKIA